MNTKTVFARLGPRAIAFLISFGILHGCASRAPLARRAVELNLSGASSYAAGDFETAATRFGLAIEYNERFTEAWVNLGLVELARGNLVTAGEYLRRARTLNRELPAPHHALGLLAEQLNLMSAAEKHYRAALLVDPGFFPARGALALALFNRGAYEESREQFARMVETSPSQPQGWAGLSVCLRKLGRVSESDEIAKRVIHQAERPPPQTNTRPQ